MQGKKTYNLYYCSNMNCPNPNKKSVHQTDIELELFHYLESIRPDPERFKGFSDALIKRFEQRRGEFETTASNIRKRIDVLEEEKENLFKLGRQGALDADELKIEKDKIKKSISELKLELNETHEEEFKIELLLEYAESFFRTLHLFWQEASPSQKVKLQRILFPSGIIYSYPGFSNSQLAPGFNVILEFASVDSDLVTQDLTISNSMVDDFVVFVNDLVEVFP